MRVGIITIMTTTIMMRRLYKPPSRRAGGDRAKGPARDWPCPWPRSPAVPARAEGGSLPARALLRLLIWLSPSFPTGGFAYSHGIEWAVEAGDIADGDSLRDWLADILVHGAGRSDAILLRHAGRPGADLRVLAEFAAAMAPARERRAETLSQGTAFARAAAGWSCPPLPNPVPYPIAVGALAGAHCIDRDAVVAAYLQAFAANLISAAVRLVPLGQSTGLTVLARLEPIIHCVTADTRAATLDDIGGATLRSDIAAMCHETQYTRLFRS
jgi:urease accessory protein